MADSKQKEYKVGDLVVVWKPDLCIHSANCVRGLPGVFNPKARPWINVEGASSDQIEAQINKCPSGALSFYHSGDPEEKSDSKVPANKVSILKDGPIMIEGPVCLINPDGSETIKEKKAFLCRCGASSNKPFCDGSHKKNGFKD